jgi:hypothetical protein
LNLALVAKDENLGDLRMLLGLKPKPTHDPHGLAKESPDG